MVICLERDADLHMAQLMPLPLTVSCFSKIRIGFTFLVPAHPGSPGKRAVKRMCVCVCLYACVAVSEGGSEVQESRHAATTANNSDVISSAARRDSDVINRRGPTRAAIPPTPMSRTETLRAAPARRDHSSTAPCFFCAHRQHCKHGVDARATATDGRDGVARSVCWHP